MCRWIFFIALLSFQQSSFSADSSSAGSDTTISNKTEATTTTEPLKKPEATLPLSQEPEIASPSSTTPAAAATPAATAPATTTPAAVAPPIDKLTWSNKFQNDAGQNFCQSNMDFVACFKTTPEECVTQVNAITKSCLSTLQLPNMLDPQTAKQFASIASLCVRNVYYSTLASKRVAIPGCPEIKKPDLPKPSIQDLSDPTRPE